jgi:hypothetical protein
LKLSDISFELAPCLLCGGGIGGQHGPHDLSLFKFQNDDATRIAAPCSTCLTPSSLGKATPVVSIHGPPLTFHVAPSAATNKLRATALSGTNAPARITSILIRKTARDVTL